MKVIKHVFGVLLTILTTPFLFFLALTGIWFLCVGIAGLLER